MMNNLKITNDLLQRLRARGVITREHAEITQTSSDNSRAVDTLLRTLEHRDGSLLPGFLKLLEESGQRHIAELLLSESDLLLAEQAIKEKMGVREVLWSKRALLAHTLDVSYTLLHSLLARGIITQEKYAEIERHNSNAKRVDCLIAILERRPAEQFLQFLHAVEEDGQPHVVRMLQPVGDALTILPAKETKPCRFENNDCKHKIMIELEETLEPDYGLMQKLEREKVLTLDQIDTVGKEKSLKIECHAYCNLLNRIWGV